MKYLILLLTLNAQAKIIDDKVYYPPLGTTADCMYNFTKIEADGARYYMKWIEGEIQYYYTSEGYPYYTVNFKRTLDKMKVDRALNWDIKEVDESYCRNFRQNGKPVDKSWQR